MELKIVQPETSSSLPAVQWNYEQMKEELELAVKKYEGITFNEDQVKEAKTTRANLNNFKNALETKRKEIKNYFLTPYNEFESQYKSLLVLIDKPINEIDSQVKKFEEAEKAAKKADLEAYFGENNPLPNIVTFNQIFNEKWLNATVKIDKAREEIETRCGIIRKDIRTIETLGGEYQSRMKEEYYKTLDLADAIVIQNKLEELKKKEAEIQAKKADFRSESGISLVESESFLKYDKAESMVEEKPEPEDLEQVDFRVWVTKEQKAMIREFLKNNNIKYGSVKNVA